MTGATFAPSALDAVKDTDACVIVTEWPEFSELDWPPVRQRMARGLVIDGRAFLDQDVLMEAGFTVEGIGTAVRSLDVLDIGARIRWREAAVTPSDLEAARSTAVGPGAGARPGAARGSWSRRRTRCSGD